MFEINNRNTRTRCEICSKLIKKYTQINVFLLLFEGGKLAFSKKARLIFYEMIKTSTKLEQWIFMS